MVGNFIADALAVDMRETLPMGIQQGIKHHMAIDKFTDAHPKFKESKALLRPYYRHYAGVVVDVLYDYFLHKHWARFSQQSVEEFITQFYTTMELYKPQLPRNVQYLYELTKSRAWLYKYATIEGLNEVFRGMDGRTKMKSGMTHATEKLILHEDELDSQFVEFFGEMVEKFNRIDN